ncbi:MAG: aminotransferase class V-fold PLP-dependent enzyme [Proteobacteria bacterium]|nr:aminotransferase class V-fold PLP-dependent enzyme [Pseudomonadota bacterium]
MESAKVHHMTPEQPAFMAKVPNNKALMLDEKLLFEQSTKGRMGVDLPALKGTKSRTGLAERAKVGLPEVSEPQVVRHFVRLSQKNYSIDGGLFPLGSCTMKHNPRLNEKMARLPGFARIHPMQPDSTVQGALALMHDLSHWLTTLTGLPGITLTPAAGTHGELTGMMVIRKAHEAAGKPRKIVLVPDSAHGTNPATAVTCGYTTYPIPTNEKGHVDMAAFTKAVDELGEDIAAFMLTNPSTCGLFEPDIKNIADKLHSIGAWFYCDGANFNAIVGKVRPGDLGVDVMQFNLHKTFSTPHGGGGPGCGPVVVSQKLIPYLPVPRVEKKGNTYSVVTKDATSIGRIKGFNGQFGMMVRALTYMLSHGADGLQKVAEDAVINANYILAHLKDTYHVPFKSTCMHECLLTDKRQKETGVTTMDIAKSLIEHGYHPMTVYFPLVVQGAMLIEPTETETKETLDEFIATMKKIAWDAANGNADALHANPVSAPARRLDEVRAARQPVLRWQTA